MKILFSLAAAATAIGSICFAASNNPVLMNIGGKDVRVSEFEYLYNKNKSQQETPVSLDDYVGMFVDYKLKVRAAESAGLDTTAKFQEDIRKFATELALPYLTDSTVVDSLEHVTYDRMHTNVDVSHIMITNESAPSKERQKALLDSLRTVALSGATDFATLATQYSDDKSTAKRGGRLGFIPVGRYPYEIEDRAFSMADGEISEPFATRFGMHIIKVNGHRPDIGKVKVRHILKLYHDDPAAAKASADSIYEALLAGADFMKLAMATTDDPQGKKTGGDIPWFGSAAMVPEFEQAVFSMTDGQLSAPIATSYGYHVVRRDASKQVGTFDEERASIQRMMERDERSQMGVNSTLDRLAAGAGMTQYDAPLQHVKDAIAACDNTRKINERLGEVTDVVLSVGPKSYSVGDIAKRIPIFVTPDNYYDAFTQMIAKIRHDDLLEMAEAKLANENTSYYNLLNEYRDGILLYEISDAEVWNKANTDTEGLARFFEEHRQDYSWDKPRFKGFVLMSVTDSIGAKARDFINAHPEMEADTLNKYLRRTFGNTIRLERVLAPQGANPIVDYVAFGGPRPASMSIWKSFTPVRSRVIAQPEEVADVKGLVSVDYQKLLEKEWMDRLHRTYPVKINNKVLNTLR